MTDHSPNRAGKAAALVLLVATGLGAVASIFVLGFAWLWRSTTELVIGAACLVAIHGGLIAISVGLRRARTWARRAGIGVALLLSLVFPLGTLIGGYILFQLILRWPDGPDGPDGEQDAEQA